MVYKYYPNESRIHDYLTFPSCDLVSESLTETDQESNYRDLIPEESVEIFKEVEEKLKPYSDEIRKYYFKENNLPSLLKKTQSFFGYQDEKEYLKALRMLASEDITRAIVYALVMIDTEKPYVEIDKATVDQLVKDEQDLMSFIDGLDLSGDEKWRISTILRNPKLAVDQWIDLLETIEPIFNTFYGAHIEEVLAYGEAVEKRLNESGGEAWSQMTGGILSASVVPSGQLLISLVNMYAIQLNALDQRPYVAFGLKIESLFIRMSEARESIVKNKVLTFKNLGDKTRYEVLKAIANGNQSTKNIAKSLGVSSATVSYHISNLTTSKLLILERHNGKYENRVNKEWLESCFEMIKEDLFDKLS